MKKRWPMRTSAISWPRLTLLSLIKRPRHGGKPSRAEAWWQHYGGNRLLVQTTRDKLMDSLDLPRLNLAELPASAEHAHTIRQKGLAALSLPDTSAGVVA
jgi:hypothetical protein